jgi:shikimate 5-dehydrogenase
MSTLHFASISKKPGKTGTFFYNRAFELLNFDATYSAISCITLTDANQILCSGKFSCVSVSMPFKREIVKTCTNAGSVNSIVLRGDQIIGFSTDLEGVEKAIDELLLGSVKILGDGAVASIFTRCLADREIPYSQFARSNSNWNMRNTEVKNLINCTPIGMGGVGSPVTSVTGTSIAIDLVIGAVELRKACINSGVKYFSGIDFYKEVFKRQFKLYTGIEISNDLCDVIAKEWEDAHV